MSFKVIYKDKFGRELRVENEMSTVMFDISSERSLTRDLMIPIERKVGFESEYASFTEGISIEMLEKIIEHYKSLPKTKEGEVIKDE